jgi:anti-anti-sigma factor
VSDEPRSHETSREASPCQPGAPTITATLAQSQLDTTVCTVAGTINRDTMPVLRDALAEAHRDDNAHLVIDLSAVTSMNSAGLYTLLAGLYTFLGARPKHTLDGGGHLAIVIDSNSRAIPELYVVGLKASFDVHHDLAGALHACTSAGTDSGP